MNWPQDKAGAGREIRQESTATAGNSWKLAKVCFLWFCLLGWLSTCRAQPAAAQDKPDLKAQVAPRSQAQVDDPVSVEGASQEPVAQPEANPAEKPDENADDKDERRKHKGSIVVAPLPIVSPAIGKGVIPVFGYIFPFEEKTKISPPSAIGAAGLFTDNGTRGFGLGADLFLKKDRYELKSFYVHGNINYDLYGVGFDNGNSGLKLPLKQTGQIFFIEFLRVIRWKVFVGPRFVNGDSFITLNATTGDLSKIPPDLGLHDNLRAIGFRVIRDSRLNRFYPTQGALLDFTGDFFSQGLGSKYSFQSYKFTFNKYLSFGERQVLAYNLFLCGTGGQPPFYGNCIYGVNNELRGYQAGRYLDRYMFATQLEYRLVLPWRFGVVAFGGLGSVAPGAGQFRTDQFLPSGGTGIRFLLSRQYHVNLRTDFAWGKDTFTWSVGIAEAF